jgi:phage-related tail protein
MVVPTPAAALIDAAGVIGGAFNFMPVVTGALALFVVAALGWKYGGRVLNWVLRFGAK